MIKELSELGKKIRNENASKKLVHDAIKDEPFSIDLIIRLDGTFERFEVMDKRMTQAESITAKKGKARLLLDKAEEVLGWINNKTIKVLKKDVNAEIKVAAYLKTVESKHTMFLSKINDYKELIELKSVLSFYNENRANGLDKALSLYEKQIEEKQRSENIAFRLINKGNRVHEEPTVYKKIIENYENDQNKKMSASLKVCSLCGKSNYPVEDEPHGMIKNVTDGQKAGCALVSYNANAFESYELEGNNNSSICSNCARTYVEGLNYLLANGKKIKTEDKKRKVKEDFRYTNRKKLGFDTVMIFWTRDNVELSEMDLLDRPNTGEVANLINSVASGEIGIGKYLETDDRFYSCTLSGAAARIAVRDWIEVSLQDFQKSIASWFKDIEIVRYDWELKNTVVHYSRLYEMARSGQNDKADNDTSLPRIASHLWNTALKNSVPPLWIMTEVIKRTQVDDKGITPERAALIKLILNRNNKGGYPMIQVKLDPGNTKTAYVWGQIFSVMESIQRAALGKEINAGIRERYFSSASTTPSSTFGRIMKQTQNHLTKLKGEKAGLAVIFDQELCELVAKLNELPTIFSLEDQGFFAIGYYHQRQAIFEKAKEKKELKEAIEEEIK